MVEKERRLLVAQFSVPFYEHTAIAFSSSIVILKKKREGSSSVCVLSHLKRSLRCAPVGGGLAFEKKKKRRMGTALKFDFSSRPTTKKQKEGLCLLLCLIDEICFCFFFSILFCKKIIIKILSSCFGNYYKK
jgi:hypothetical protein